MDREMDMSKCNEVFPRLRLVKLLEKVSVGVLVGVVSLDALEVNNCQIGVKGGPGKLVTGW